VLDSFLDAVLADLEATNSVRAPGVVERVDGPRLWINGRELVSFASNDYLGLAQHPALAAAAAAAARTWGWGASASRAITGTTTEHIELEKRFGAWKGAQALSFASGYHANLGLLGVLARDATVLSDALNHASIIDGLKLARAKVVVLPHADVDAFERALKLTAGRRLIVTESVFSMDGDIAPLGALADLADRHGADLIVDDAHATGVMGKHGRGALEEFGLESRVAAHTATLSKAAGSAGGFAVGSERLMTVLRSKARSFLFSTAPPAAMAAAGRAAIDLVAKADDRRRILRGHMAKLGRKTPIWPVLLGSNERALAASRKLLEAGFFVPAVRPPTVPEGTARLRITLSAHHTADQIHALQQAIETL
jgi:8-amino-7-oxononanoate synthase